MNPLRAFARAYSTVHPGVRPGVSSFEAYLAYVRKQAKAIHSLDHQRFHWRHWKHTSRKYI